MWSNSSTIVDAPEIKQVASHMPRRGDVGHRASSLATLANRASVVILVVPLNPVAVESTRSTLAEVWRDGLYWSAETTICNTTTSSRMDCQWQSVEPDLGKCLSGDNNFFKVTDISRDIEVCDDALAL